MAKIDWQKRRDYDLMREHRYESRKKKDQDWLKSERKRIDNIIAKKREAKNEPNIPRWTLSGRYQNYKLDEVPDSYLTWIVDHFQIGSVGYKMAHTELKKRKTKKVEKN